MTQPSVTRIGRYQVLKPLGRGTMGVVYLAEDPALERLIALKTIDLAVAVPEPERDAFEQRFLTEARVAASLSHPGIVVVHDVGRDAESGTLFIALEYLPGRTLEDIMAGGTPLEWHEALRITGQVSRALHHAHLHGIVHRDVKPANVMLLPSGETKIMDFGIAKVPHSHLTAAGQFFGTPLYMSPEQALGNPVDARSDLFSLGAIAYLLLTGRQAFKADNVMEVLARVVHDMPTPPSRSALLSHEVDVLVARALAKNPDDRYPDAESFAQDIDNVVAGRPLAEAVWLGDTGLAEEASMGTRRSTEEVGTPSRGTTHTPRPTAEATPRATPAPGLAPPAATASVRIDAGTGFSRRTMLRLIAALASVALGLLVLVVMIRAPKTAPTTSPSPPKETPPRVALATPSPPTSPEKPTPKPSREPEKEEAPIPADESRLAIDFEHHLKTGTLRVSIDEGQVLEEALDARVAKKILTIPIRKGSVDEVLQVKPGKHKVTVQVAWSDKVRSKWITGTFKGGASRTLKIRVGRLFGDLSLEWK